MSLVSSAGPGGRVIRPPWASAWTAEPALSGWLSPMLAQLERAGRKTSRLLGASRLQLTWGYSLRRVCLSSDTCLGGGDPHLWSLALSTLEPPGLTLTLAVTKQPQCGLWGSCPMGEPQAGSHQHPFIHVLPTPPSTPAPRHLDLLL